MLLIVTIFNMKVWGGKDKDKNLSIKDYLDKIKPYLIDMKWRIYSGNTIIEHKTQGEWKIQLTMVTNFIFPVPDSDETRTMHTRSDNIDVMMGS